MSTKLPASGDPYTTNEVPLLEASVTPLDLSNALLERPWRRWTSPTCRRGAFRCWTPSFWPKETSSFLTDLSFLKKDSSFFVKDLSFLPLDLFNGPLEVSFLPKEASLEFHLSNGPFHRSKIENHPVTFLPSPS